MLIKKTLVLAAHQQNLQLAHCSYAACIMHEACTTYKAFSTTTITLHKKLHYVHFVVIMLLVVVFILLILFAFCFFVEFKHV